MAIENPTLGISSRIVKNGIALIVARITVSLGTFLLVIFVSRSLDVEGFGIYSTVLTFYATLEIFASLGFTNYIPREVGRSPEHAGEYLSHSVIAAVGSGLLLLTLAHFITPYLGYNDITVAGIRISLLALVPAALISVSQSFLIAYEKAEYITLLNFFEVTTRVVSSIYLLYLGYGVLSVIMVFCLLRYISLGCYAFILLRQIGHLHWNFDYGFFRHFVKDLAVFSALIVAGGLFTTIDTLALSLIKNETAVGIYNAGARLVSVWSIIPASIMNAALPSLSRLYRNARGRFEMLVEKSLRYLSLVVFPLVIGTTVVADEIVTMLYGESFAETAVVLRLLIWSLIPLFLDDALWRVLLASDYETFTLRVTVINLLIMIVLCVILIPPLGYIGAGLVVNLVLLLEAGAYAAQVQMHVTKIRYHQVALKPLVASLAMGLVALVLKAYLPLAAVIFISVLIYCIAAFLLRATSFHEIISLWKQVRPETSYELDI